MVTIEIIYGTGRGKTTNAIGKLFKELISGEKATIVQFLKTGKNCGECKFLQEKFKLEWFAFGKETFFRPKHDKAAFQRLIKTGLEKVKAYLKGNSTDILVLDELGIALYFDLVRWKEVAEIFVYVRKKILITGRKIPETIRKKADKQIHIKEKKHPYSQGVLAREGIDY